VDSRKAERIEETGFTEYDDAGNPGVVADSTTMAYA
jgi:hypothetical protein